MKPKNPEIFGEDISTPEYEKNIGIGVSPDQLSLNFTDEDGNPMDEFGEYIEPTVENE